MSSTTADDNDVAIHIPKVVMRNKRNTQPAAMDGNCLDETKCVSTISAGLQISESHTAAGHVLKKKWELRPKSQRDSFIKCAADTFEQLVRESNVVVDKSLFIHDLWKERMKTHGFGFALPSGSGKTMMLTMLDSFFNMENSKRSDDLFDGGQFYKRFAIMEQEQIVQHHRYKYPILFIDLDMEVSSASGVEYMLSVVIAHLYTKHENAFAGSERTKEQYENFSNISTRGHPYYGKENWQEALNFLIERLNAGSKRKTILLIDNYDAAITNFWYHPGQRSYSEELSSIINYVTMFMNILINAKNVEFIVIMGNYKIALENVRIETYSMDRDLDFMRDGDLSQYFGFTEAEMNVLFECYNVSSDIREGVKAYFNGFTFSSIQLFGTWSAMKMFSCIPGKNPLKVHLVDTPFFRRFYQLFTKEKFIRAIEKLFNNGKYQPGLFLEFSSRQMHQLLSYVHAGQTSPIDDRLVNIFFCFLNASGYLVRKGNDLYIPNEEYRQILTDLWTVNWYKPKYHFSMTEIDAITEALNTIALRNDKSKGGTLKSALCKCLKNVIEEEGDTDEEYLQTVVGVACLRMRYRTRCRLDKVLGGSSENKRKRPDIAVYSATKKFAIVVELKWNNQGQHPLWQIAENKYFSRSFINWETELNYVIAIGIAVNSLKLYENNDDGIDINIEFNEKEEQQNITEFLRQFEDELQKKYVE